LPKTRNSKLKQKVALEKFEYPASGPVTNSWLPTRNPSYDGARPKREWGVVQQISSGKKAYLYEQGITCHYYRRSYKRMAESEWNSYLTFRGVVLGAPIKYTDQAGATHTVTFWDFETEADPSPGDRYSFGFLLREEL
jgi:hypothetical protein